MRPVVPIVIAIISFQKLEFLDGQRPENSRLNFFDTDLLRYSAEERRGNVMVSPASVKSTLAMVLEAAGAGGATAAEIRSALRLSPNKNEFREQLNLYLRVLQSNAPGAYLHNANSVFVSNKLRLKKEYETMLRTVYMAELCRLDFRDPLSASDVVNNWVSNATRGLIPTIIEPVNINPATNVLLTNALYFKGAWRHGFKPEATHGACFHHQGACRTVAMMELHAELNYAYVDNLRSHAVELPYEGGRYSMVLLVPQDRDGCAALVRDLPYMSLPQISKLCEPTDVTLTMPKFTVDYSEDMVGPLRAMRITSLFSNHSDLSGMFDGDSPQVNNIFHKVHMAVDEVGTVAAAATSAMVIPLIESGVQLRVDRPFVFFIRDNSLGLVLFEGKIEEPTVYEQNEPIGQHAVKKNNRNFSIKNLFQ